MKRGYAAYKKEFFAYPFHFKELTNPEHRRLFFIPLKTELNTHVNFQKMCRWYNPITITPFQEPKNSSMKMGRLKNKYRDRFCSDNYEELFY